MSDHRVRVRSTFRSHSRFGVKLLSLSGVYDWQRPQPIFGIVFGDFGASATLACSQATRLYFLVGCRSAGIIALTKLSYAHCPLASAAFPLGFRYFRIGIHHAVPPSWAGQIPAITPVYVLARRREVDAPNYLFERIDVFAMSA